jgi:hypothetical protein
VAVREPYKLVSSVSTNGARSVFRAKTHLSSEKLYPDSLEYFVNVLMKRTTSHLSLLLKQGFTNQSFMMPGM